MRGKRERQAVADFYPPMAGMLHSHRNLALAETARKQKWGIITAPGEHPDA